MYIVNEQTMNQLMFSIAWKDDDEDEDDDDDDDDEEEAHFWFQII